MPQVFNIENDRIRVRTSFVGIRQCLLFRWLPYVTYNRPQIQFALSLRSTDFKIKGVGINCVDPEVRSDSLYSNNYGWNARYISGDGLYKLSLPPLIGGGIRYDYNISVRLSYQYKGEEQELYENGLIMTTGNVPYAESIATHILAALFGAALSLAVQWVWTLFQINKAIGR